MDENIINRDYFNIPIKLIADHMFDILREQSVLELGASDGWFTKHILDYTNRVTCLEFNQMACETLRNKFGNNITVVAEDLHSSIRTIGQFDAVILYGVLYHSCAPLQILEDTANIIKPTYILLECWDKVQHPDSCAVIHEIPNIPGSRYSDSPTCGLAISLGKNLMIHALNSLGYTKQREFVLDEHPMRQAAGVDDFKSRGIYMLFKRCL